MEAILMENVMYCIDALFRQALLTFHSLLPERNSPSNWPSLWQLIKVRANLCFTSVSICNMKYSLIANYILHCQKRRTCRMFQFSFPRTTLRKTYKFIFYPELLTFLSYSAFLN